jgi:hypothetical protein
VQEACPGIAAGGFQAALRFSVGTPPALGDRLTMGLIDENQAQAMAAAARR